MPSPPAPSAPRRHSPRLLLLAALAYAGGTIGYLPLLSLLLPIKVEAMAGDARIGVLAGIVIAGAIAASLSNILFGWLSDRSVARGGGRRGWILLGLAGLAVAYAMLAAVRAPGAIIAGVILFQCAVNAVLAPLLAVMADEIPDSQKGLAGGLMALANSAAAAMGALVVSIGPHGEALRFAIIVCAATACVLPLALTPAQIAATGPATPAEERLLRRDLLLAWAARLFVQVAGNVLSLYLLYYFESVAPGETQHALATKVSHKLTLAYLVPLPITLLLGRLSDRIGRRKPILFGAALLTALGLLVMAFARNGEEAQIGFGAYAIGSQVFVNLHAAFAMQLLPDPAHRGRDLGVLNLTNTLPALIGPALAWLLATPQDFAPLMLALAGLTLGGGVLMLAVRGRR